MHTQKLTTNSRLLRLRKYLNYELPGLGIGYYFVFMFGGIFLYAVILAAVVFAPYMLYVLFKENKKGWIISFIALIIVPLLFSIIAALSAPNFNLLLFIPLLLFFVYCFVLRFEVNSWVREYNARQAYLLNKKRYEEEKAAYFNNLK